MSSGISAPIVSLPNTIGTLANDAGKWVARQLGREPSEVGNTAKLMPSYQGTKEAVESVTGKLHEPQTTAGEYAQTIGEFAPKSIAVTPDIENYLDFVMSMCLAFGATFEVPVVVVILVRMGIVSVEKLREVRPYAVVGAFVIAIAPGWFGVLVAIQSVNGA